MSLPQKEIISYLEVLKSYYKKVNDHDPEIYLDLCNIKLMMESVCERQESVCICTLFEPIIFNSVLVAYHCLPKESQYRVRPLVECMHATSCHYLGSCLN